MIRLGPFRSIPHDEHKVEQTYSQKIIYKIYIESSILYSIDLTQCT
jgi:hypothetical protein